jgi:hypothetical protein
VRPDDPIQELDQTGLGSSGLTPAVATTPDSDPVSDTVQPPNEIGMIPPIHSVVVMKKIPEGQRKTAGLRDDAIRAGLGDPVVVEGSIYAALRWLKKHQEPDGSWNTKSGMGGGGVHPAGMTGLALLTYLGHGETTDPTTEFGPTVKKAIQWLIAHQGPDGGFARAYEHPIATYALCEAYTMTRIPAIATAASKGVDVIIRGQNPSGGFSYELQPCDRNDTSVMGWCAQALKAAQIAGLRNVGLDDAMKKTLAAFRANYRGNSEQGGFGYIGPDISGLTGVGVVCHQMLGQSKGNEVKGGLAQLATSDRFQWSGATWKNVYYWYYNTQARFQEGGECWKTWEHQFAAPLMKAQVREHQAARTPKGRSVDLGYWDTNNDRGGRVMDTTLCTLTLEVYYRYLPTYRRVEMADDTTPIAGVPDVDLDIRLPDFSDDRKTPDGKVNQPAGPITL